MKYCNKCKTLKNDNEFHSRNKALGTFSSNCKICRKLIHKQHYQANRNNYKEKSLETKNRNREFIIEYLKLHPCIDCGEKDPIVLEFDHLSNKSKLISKMVNDGNCIKSIQKEIDKCVVRCANCHRRKTAKDFNYYKLN